MQFSFNVNQDLSFFEYFKGALYYFNNKRFKIFIAIIFIFPLLSDIFALLTITNYRISLTSVFLSLIPIGILLLMAFTITLIVCSYFYNIKPQFFKNISYSFNHWGIIRNSEISGFSKPWREISKFKETKSFFLLYISGLDFHIVQKRKFNSSEDVANFRALLKENIKH
jgi:hypothetical protein